MAEAPPDLESVAKDMEQQIPDIDMGVLKEVVEEINADVKEKPSLRRYADEAASYLKDIMVYCKDSTPQRRISVPYDSLARFTGLVTNYYDKWKWQDCEPRVILIGETGAGKSSLGNILLEGRCPEERFKVGGKFDSETKEFKEDNSHWLGIRSKRKVTVIDTPGTNDSTLTDPEIMEHFIKEVNKMKYLTTFLLVFNSENPRFTQAHKKAIDAFMGAFGIEMFSNLLVVFTRWKVDPRSVEERSATEDDLSQWFTEKLRKEFEIESEIPYYFLDCKHYQNPNTPEQEVKQHEATLERLIEKVESLSPYKTIDKDKLFEKEQMIKNLLKQVLKRSKQQSVVKEEDKQKVESFECCINDCLAGMEQPRYTTPTGEDRWGETRRTERSIEAQTNIRRTKKKVEEEEGSSWGWLLGGAFVLLLAIMGIRR